MERGLKQLCRNRWESISINIKSNDCTSVGTSAPLSSIFSDPLAMHSWRYYKGDDRYNLQIITTILITSGWNRERPE